MTDEIRINPSNVSLGARLGSLLIGPTYLFAVAFVFSAVNEKSIWITLPVVTVGAVVIMAVLAILSHKLNRADHTASHFALSTIFLVAVPICIYLAAIRWFLIGVLRYDPNAMNFRVYPLGLLVLAFWAVFTTVVLLSFAEAIMWLVIRSLRLRATAKSIGQTGPTPYKPGF